MVDFLHFVITLLSKLLCSLYNSQEFQYERKAGIWIDIGHDGLKEFKSQDKESWRKHKVFLNAIDIL